jgi:hypothetical protein
MAHDVFISYSAQDKPIADAVCATLEAHGIRCWIAPRDILPGIDWGEAIIDGIAESKMMVLIFSSNANKSSQIKHEVERAVHHCLPIVPLRVEDVVPSKSLEYFISTPHWLDALTPPLEQHLARLAQTAKLLINRVEMEVTDSVEPACNNTAATAAGVRSGAEEPIMQFCIHCGTQFNPGDIFCVRCGQKV